MAKKPSQPQDSTQDSDRQFIIKQVFIKKTVLDVTLAPFELTAQWQPDASMQIDVHTEKLADDDYIVELKTNIDVKNDTFLPTQLSSAEYEAMFHIRSRRV